jgi:uncharacterized paraquat-inducible protein A
MTQQQVRFDDLFNKVTGGSRDALLHKGKARLALKYADFDLNQIDQPALAERIISQAVADATAATSQRQERTAAQVPLPAAKADRCPRCNSALPMKAAELLEGVSARYCPSCRLTEIA